MKFFLTIYMWKYFSISPQIEISIKKGVCCAVGVISGSNFIFSCKKLGVILGSGNCIWHVEEKGKVQKNNQAEIKFTGRLNARAMKSISETGHRGVSFHCCAADTHMYFPVKPTDPGMMNSLQDWPCDFRELMAKHCHQANPQPNL